MARSSLTRQELYELVWSKPISQIAPEYGISDVGLAKLCRRNDIPRPPRGYWAKLRNGHRVRRQPLPETRRGTEAVVEIQGDSNVRTPRLSEVEAINQGRLKTMPPLEVRSTIRGAHPFVLQTKEQLANAKTGDNGLLTSREELTLHLSVSRNLVSRALRIMDAVLRFLEQDGYSLAPGPRVTMLDQVMHFGIKEQLLANRSQSGDPDLSGDYIFGHSRFTTTYAPAGRLTIFVLNADSFWAAGCRKSWSDAKKQQLEGCLQKFIAGLLTLAQCKREHEMALAERKHQEQLAQARREADKQLRAEKRKQQADEQCRLADLIQQAADWQQSKDLRAFIDAYKANNSELKISTDPDSSEGRWLDWAIRQADRLDPFVESPPSILDEQIPDEPRYGW